MSSVPTDNKHSAKDAQSMLVQITTDGIPKLHCPTCDKALVSLNGYVKHVKKHEPPGGFLCRFCDARFCTDDELKRHLDSIHTTIACRICKNVTFKDENTYREHIREQHNGIDRELFICDKCGAEYKTPEPYKRHLETLCGTQKPFKCEQCSLTFVTKYNLKQHMESHNGERKYCCSYCGKNFLQKGRLVDHERSHTGEKPYKCDVCGKCFAHRESIVTHSSIHTGVRLVECKCCQSRFSCYSNLIKHRRTRPDTCGRAEYDPPKNRVRTHRSRIPPLLNPTSEIRVNNGNKIIKPDDLLVEKQKRRLKDQQKETRGSSSKQKTNREDKNDTESTEKFTAAMDSKEPQINTRQTRRTCHSSKPSMEIPIDFVEDNESDNYYPEFDPINSDSNEGTDFKMPFKPKEEQSVIENFEYTDTQFVETPFVFKEERNIFNDKDQLLDVLLQVDEDNMVKLNNSTCDESIKHESHDGILDETEVMIIRNEQMASSEEDILAMKDKDISECKIYLKDITLRYPQLKDEKCVKVPRPKRSTYFTAISELKETDFMEENDIDKPKKKFRKRKGSVSEATSKTKKVAKITQQELKERMKLLKKEEKPWKCPQCIKIYHMRKPFEKHLRDDHNYDEDAIKSMFSDEDKTANLGEDIFSCKICGKIYLMEKRLNAHVLLHGPDGTLTYKCPCYCNLYFANKEEATSHAQKEHRDLLYCEKCNKFMTGHDSLKSHIKNHHSDKRQQNQPRNLVCDKCGKKFSGRTSLTDHVRSDCGRVPLYPCTVCGKHLTTAGILKTHLLLHKDETPFQCEKCGKTFKVKAQYRSHIKTRHTDYKPFKCHLCPKEYPYRESLLTHMTVHTGIKRFLCNGCGKRFTCISNLQAHRKVHADTCGQLPLNAKATQYMGVQKGNLLLGAKPEAGLEYEETNTLIAKEVLDHDMPMAQELNFPSEPSAPLATVPLNCSTIDIAHICS